MDNWKTNSLAEICQNITDGKHGDCKPEPSSGFYFLSAKDIVAGKLNYVGAREITKEDFLETHKRTRLETNDILITNSGTIGRMAIVKNSPLTSRTTFQKSVAIIKPKKEIINPFFLYYYLTSNKQTLIETAGGTTQQNLLLKDLRNFRVSIPPIEEQKAIAKILSSLDDKIELNRRMNETLEAIARALFKAWFVDFEPVRANMENRPSESASPEIAKLFPSEFENGIPKGWRRRKVKDVCKVNINTLSNKDTLEVIKYIEISEVLNGVINNISLYKKGEEPSRAKRKLSHGDVVISTVRPDRGSYFMAFYPEKDLIASTGFAVFTAELVPFSFLYIFLTDTEQLTYYGKLADGAAYPAINQSVIMDIDLIIPSSDLLKQFHSIVEPTFARIAHNLKESKSLAQIRDSLLPRLISGKIRVGELDGCYNAASRGVLEKCK